MKPRVFVVNQPVGKSGAPAIDISSAEEHGELVFLLPPGRISLDDADVVATLAARMEDFESHDFLLPIGDMTACILAASIAAVQTDGRYHVLRWNGDARRYKVVPVDL